MSYFSASCIVRCNNTLNGCLSLFDTLNVVTNHKDMLFVVIVGLRHHVCSLFLRSFTSNQNFAARLFFKSFLVKTFRTNEHTNVVDSWILRNVNFLFNFVVIRNHSIQRVVELHVFKLFVTSSAFFVQLLVVNHYFGGNRWQDCSAAHQKLVLLLFLRGISPLVFPLATVWRSAWDEDEIFVCFCFFPLHFKLETCLRLLDCLKLSELSRVWNQIVGLDAMALWLAVLLD